MQHSLKNRQDDNRIRKIVTSRKANIAGGLQHPKHPSPSRNLPWDHRFSGMNLLISTMSAIRAALRALERWAFQIALEMIYQNPTFDLRVYERNCFFEKEKKIYIHIYKFIHYICIMSFYETIYIYIFCIIYEYIYIYILYISYIYLYLNIYKINYKLFKFVEVFLYIYILIYIYI